MYFNHSCPLGRLVLCTRPFRKTIIIMIHYCNKCNLLFLILFSLQMASWCPPIFTMLSTMIFGKKILQELTKSPDIQEQSSKTEEQATSSSELNTSIA